MNKNISIFCKDGLAFEYVEGHMDSVPHIYREDCQFVVVDGGFCIEYCRPETAEEEQERIREERRIAARKIIEGKRLVGEELPEWTKNI